MPRKATLILENGRTFVGTNFGAMPEPVPAEVVFNTSMTGYQEILTDPSYLRQIVVMTAAEIGNTGANSLDLESDRLFASGLIVRDYPSLYSNWRAEESLGSLLRKHRVPGLAGVETREIVKALRIEGCLRGIIVSGEPSQRSLLDSLNMLRSGFSMNGSNLAVEAGTQTQYRYQSRETDPYAPDRSTLSPLRIAVIDFGCKRGILDQLSRRFAEVIVVPPRTCANDLMSLQPSGILFSNGPGDPAAVESGIELARALIGNVPVMGICLGHQILGISLGLKTYKLKFGHHGGNHPVKSLQNNSITITSQNHNFAVDLEAAVNHPAIEVTHINLNDQTLEGFRLRTQPLIAIQYHPEAAPGPHDSRSLFDQFELLVESGADAKAD